MRSTSMMWRLVALGAALALLASGCGGDDETKAVSFTKPADGAAVAGGVALTMTADGITIEEAAEAREGAGHFHVIADAGCTEPGTVVPKDADHVHFGKGQAEGTIYLEPGTHDLCLLAADGGHVALAATDKLTVNVGIDDRDEWCAVSGEADELFEAARGRTVDFQVRQAGYENGRRLMAQLAEAIDQVDANAAVGVTAYLDVASRIATAFVDADDEDGAIAAMKETFGTEGIQSDGPGATWILDTCGIDVDD